MKSYAENFRMILRVLCIVGCFINVESLVRAESLDKSAGIERAKQATVGILGGSAQGDVVEDFGISVSVKGTGIHIGHGLVVTARHAVERTEGSKQIVPETIRVLTDDLRELTAIRKGASAYMDVAVYQLSHNELEWPSSSVPVSAQAVTYGDEVFTVGYPLGWGPAISFGHIGNPNAFLPTLQSRVMQVDLSACRGNSGGGLLNLDGELIGLVHAIIQTEMEQEDRRCSRFAFALPGLLVNRVVTTLQEGRIPGFSLLGLHLGTRNKDGRWVLVIDKASGPSRHAGFRKDDVLVAINGVPITSSAQLKNYLIEQTEPGQSVTISILRGEVDKDVDVILGGG
ncbi:MAG: S1C family serine protease [Nitrospirales bacterium]|nr:S1C family serine protease [Nitrospirales bacterium]